MIMPTHDQKQPTEHSGDQLRDARYAAAIAEFRHRKFHTILTATAAIEAQAKVQALVAKIKREAGK